MSQESIVLKIENSKPLIPKYTEFNKFSQLGNKTEVMVQLVE